MEERQISVWLITYTTATIAIYYCLNSWNSGRKQFKKRPVVKSSALDNLKERDKKEIRTKQAMQFEMRRDRVQMVCSNSSFADRLKSTSFRLTMSSIMADTRHGLLYCRQAKLSDLLEEEEKKSHKFLHLTLPNHFNLTKYGVATLPALQRFMKQNNILSFSFVRHPFDRLVSAFENKILLPKDVKWKCLANKLNGSFPSFAAHVIREFESCPNNNNNKNESNNKKKNGHHCPVNIHWYRYTDRCPYCDLNFDIIGKMETFADDVKYILESRGLDSSNILHKNAVPHDDKRTSRYFSQLDQVTKRKLFDIYKADFELFGYDSQMFLV